MIKLIDKTSIMSRIVNLILILTGGLIALYAQAEENQNVYILIGGIVMLMTGLYRLSRGISSRQIEDDNASVDNQEQ
jgi:hypothetical protein